MPLPSSALPASVCVYCGSSAGAAPSYGHAAEAVGRLLAEQGIRLVYGGGRVGLMGVVADAALTAGGEVTGIIPRHLEEREVGHQKLTELIVVGTMHERKKMMVDRSEAFLVLPGGLGTLDETFEILTWKQLALHNRPVILFNVAGYWDPLLDLVRHGVRQGFVRPQHASLFRSIQHIDELLPALSGDLYPTERPSALI